MHNIDTGKENGLRYVDSVRDRNPLHEGNIAAGMWLVSRIQGDEAISGIRQVKFSKSVSYGDYVAMESGVESARGVDYIFKKGDEVALSVRGV